VSEPIRAGIYLRISTSGQEDGSSLDVQEDDCRAHAAERGYELTSVYTDVHSGADLWHRPQLQEVLADAAAGKFSVVIVHHTDRLSREPDHQAFLRVQLKRDGVAVESVTNPRTDSFQDRLMGSFEDLFAQHERVRIQARMASGRKNRVGKGRLQVGGHRLYGYRYDDPAKSQKNRYVEEPTESPVVRRVYRECVEGSSLKGIADGLNADGVPTAKGSRWHARQVSRMLANPAYRGRFYANRHHKWKDERTGRKRERIRPESEWTEIPGVVPALVDEETWRRANERLERNRVEASRPYDQAEDTLLRAGFVFCRFCGHRMSVNRRRGKLVYKCQTAYRDPESVCRGWSVEATKLDRFVWGNVESWLGDPGVLLHEARRSRPAIEAAVVEDMSSYDRGLAEIEAKQDNLARQLERLDGAAADPVLKRLTELGHTAHVLTTEREAAAGRVEAAKAASDVAASVWNEILGYADGVEDWTYQQRRELLHRLGLRVTVEKRGSGRYRFWVDVSPPWPDGTAWWPNLFADLPDGPFDVTNGEAALTDLSKSVYAAYTRTQVLAAEQESDDD